MQHYAKDLPDEIDEFYPAAAECLKSCLNNVKGQGRYLLAVIPEDMKAVKSGIAAIGHEINEITASLARYRKENDNIHAALALHTALLDIRSDIRQGRRERCADHIPHNGNHGQDCCNRAGTADVSGR